ncbi:MAG: CarD family transcriptional regulator [Lachnospiraceae bacterium]|nr:CarD family transcriptional regulator [Lachnospiraceae bacterium]
MYSVGQYVVCGNKGVCTVEDITTLDISGVDKAKLYYILKPQYISASTVYVPVENAASLREVLTREQAEQLVSEIPDIPPLKIANEKMAEQEYRSSMRSNDSTEWIRVIKTIYGRRQKRLQAGRKETAVDGRYFKMAEDSLYGELAVALGVERSQVCAYIADKLNFTTPV